MLPVLVAGTVTLTSVAPAAAAPPDDPTVAVTTAGAPSSSVVAGDTMTVTQTAPITVPGQTSQALEASWDPAQATLPTGGITKPEGWSLDYTANGSTWSSAAPADLGTVSGVRSSGSVASNGLSGGLQVSTSTGSGTLQQGAASFSGASGGDGWDVFFTSTKVLNVWHHNGGRYNLDCHLRSTGASCTTAVYGVNGYQTPMASSGTSVGDKVYSAVGENSSSSAGLLCTDTSSTPFTSCGYTSLVGGSSNYSNIGAQSRSGDRIFLPVNTSGGAKLACFDAVTETPCPGQPYDISGLAPAPNVPAWSFADTGRVFVTANAIWCFDAATGAACPGSWPVGGYGPPLHTAVPMRDTSGALTGVCMIRPAGNCFDLSGAAATMPDALSNLLGAKPVGGYSDYSVSQYGYTSTRQYWFTGSPFASSPPVCWDWATGAACAGFQTTTGIGIVRYAIAVDPLDDECLWSNGDNGLIAPFSGVTGAAGCAPSDPTVVIPYATAVPRLACAEAGRLRGWQTITLNPPAAVPTSDLRVTVRDQAGAEITGYVGRTPDSSGVIDLSALSVATSGTQPSIKITAIGATDAQAQAITAAVRYTSDPPQLCVRLTVDQQCPTARAIYSTPSVPVSDLPIGGSATATAGSTSTATPLPATVTRADMVGCLGGVGGTVTRTAGGSSTPIAGAGVQLLSPGGVVIATTTTDPSGAYSFANVVPTGYTVGVLSQDSPVTIAAGATATANFVVPVAAPTANPVHASTLQNSPATFAIDASADPMASIDTSTLVLRDGGAWVSTVTVSGEGTWDVVSGNLRFTPLIGFTGRTADVTYGVRDSFGSLAQSTASVEVSAVLPSASAIEASGVRGASLTLVPVGASAAVPLDLSATELIDPDTGAAVTTLAVAGRGTYTVDTATGSISFVPDGGFVGAHTLVYRMRDVTGRTVNAVATVTLTPITLASKVASVDAGNPASVPVNGIPAAGSPTVPGTVAGAGTVRIRDGVVSVTPRRGFSGTITVPVTVTHGTAIVVHDVVIYVHPRDAKAGRSTLADRGSIVRWKASPTSSVSGYRVYVDGNLACTTTATSCAYSRLIGPKSRVQVEAIGGEGLRSDVTAAPYVFTRCATVSDVRFRSESPRLTSKAKARIGKVAAKMRAKGFKHVCLVGHTDNRGPTSYNKRLSELRVKAVGQRLEKQMPKARVSDGAKGETKPMRANDTSGGRATNRRVSVGIG